MFYYIYEIFEFNFFSYISVRAGISFFLAFVLTLFFMPKFIAWARVKNANQPIYELAPQSHQQKGKTPTMGGVVFVICAIMATLFSANLSNAFVLIGLFVLSGFCLLGFYDDYSTYYAK